MRDNELNWLTGSSRGQFMSPMKPLLNQQYPEPPGINIYGGYKTTEQTKVLSESGVYLSFNIHD